MSQETLQAFTIRPSSAEDSPASQLAMQENAKEIEIPDGCGQNYCESLMTSDPLGYLEKTLKDSLPLDSTRCLATWKILVTPLGRSVYRLAPSGRRTEENGYLLLPTILKSDATSGAIFGKEDTYRTTKNNTLRRVNKSGKDGSVNLGRLIRLLPTLTARDYKGATKQRIEQGNPKFALDCELQMNGMILQPAFAEAFMGFPHGWTELNALATPSCRNKSTRSLKPSQKSKEESK